MEEREAATRELEALRADMVPDRSEHARPGRGPRAAVDGRESGSPELRCRGSSSGSPSARSRATEVSGGLPRAAGVEPTVTSGDVARGHAAAEPSKAHGADLLGQACRRSTQCERAVLGREAAPLGLRAMSIRARGRSSSATIRARREGDRA